MDKRALITFLILLLFSACSKQSGPGPARDIFTDTMISPDFKASRYVYHYDGANVLLDHSEHHYDVKTGQILEGKHYDASGKLSTFDIYEYNVSMNNTRHSDYNASGILLNYIINDYASTGQLQKVSYYNGLGQLQNTRIYQYDTSGNQLVEIDADHSGTLTAYYIDNFEGNVLSTYEAFSSAGVKLSYSNYDYNINGQRTHVYYYGPAGALQSSTTFYYDTSSYSPAKKYEEFDAAGKLQSYTVQGSKQVSSSVLLRAINSNDPSRVIISYVNALMWVVTSYDFYNGQGQLQNSTKFDYDNAGWINKYSNYDGSGKLLDYYENRF